MLGRLDWLLTRSMLIQPAEEDHMSSIVDICDAEKELSALIDRAAAGEEIVIAKDGAPSARLVAIPHTDAPRRPAGAMGLTDIADDFDAPDPKIDALFGNYPRVSIAV
jgi:prevent-host-death family protein